MGRRVPMKTLIYGAGPLGCLYAHRLFQARKDVTILARGAQAEFIRENGVVLVDGFTGERESSRVPVVESLEPDDAYDLIVVLIRKNRLAPVFEVLGRNERVPNILFMGNNALGFDAYLEHLPAERLLFGFPSAGGGREDGVVRYVDREKPNAKRTPITIGEIDGRTRDRTDRIRDLFETSGVPVDVTPDIDGWLKYHAALVSPLVNALLEHDCDNYALARDRATLRLYVRACKEGGNVLRALGYTKRQPFKWNLFYWLPEWMTAATFCGLLSTRYAEIAYAEHAKAAGDEMNCLAEELATLAERAQVATPSIDRLRREAWRTD
jgi:2-dehydropantoate 2-reductase